MAEPAAKRRRISVTASVPGDGEDGLNATRSQPTTPTRPSYLSPTKASLARSHPALFARSPGRSGRGKALLEELLGSARTKQATKEVVGQSRVETQPQKVPPTRTNSTQDVSRRRSSLSEAVANAFVASRPAPSQSRSPLRPRQPSATNDIRTARVGTDEDDLGAYISPKLKDKTSYESNQHVREARDELELPPTPVELGLHPAPEKPRGLWSSSPRSFRYGRRSQESSVKSSPLKPKDRNPNPRALDPGDLDPRKIIELAVEAPESDVEEAVEEARPGVPLELEEKQKERDFLQAQLSELQQDIHRLESILESPSTKGMEPLTADFVQFITRCATTSRPEIADDELILSDPLQLPSNPLPHLTLFAPGKLNLQTKTTLCLLRTASYSKPHQIHTFSLTPPSPWPAHIFGAELKVHVDPHESRIEKVHITKWRPTATTHHTTLKHWVTKRLASPLHQYDPTSFIWAMGTYFDACVMRARSLAYLDTQYNSARPAERELDLLRYLAQTSLKVTIRNTNLKPRQKQKEQALLLTWTIHLDWTGEATSCVDIDSCGFPGKAQGLIRDVFHGLRRRIGVEKAVEGVVGVITGS